MSSTIKIPTWLDKSFSECKTKQEREELVNKYKSWKQNSVTKDLMFYLQNELDQEIKKEEKNLYSTLFQFKFMLYFSRGKRSLLRKLL